MQRKRSDGNHCMTNDHKGSCVIHLTKQKVIAESKGVISLELLTNCNVHCYGRVTIRHGFEDAFASFQQNGVKVRGARNVKRISVGRRIGVVIILFSFRRNYHVASSIEAQSANLDLDVGRTIFVQCRMRVS